MIKLVRVSCIKTYLKNTTKMYTFTIQKFGVRDDLMFCKDVSYAHQGCIYLIKNTVKTVILWNIITI